MTPDKATTGISRADALSVELSPPRIHGLAIQRWISRSFFIREGFPVPSIFAGPTDALSQWSKLWKLPDNPWVALYAAMPGVVPAQPIFPLASVQYKGMRYRPEQSYSSRVQRRKEWASVNSDVRLADLATALQVRMPAAWTFRYGISLWTTRPDTQSVLVGQLARAFKVASASVPQAFIPVVYPGYYGTARERLVITSEVDDVTEAEPVDGQIKYRTAFTVELEGYCIDNDCTVVPVLWEVATGLTATSANIEDVFTFYSSAQRVDLRDFSLTNPDVVLAVKMPPGTLPQ